MAAAQAGLSLAQQADNILGPVSESGADTEASMLQKKARKKKSKKEQDREQSKGSGSDTSKSQKPSSTEEAVKEAFDEQQAHAHAQAKAYKLDFGYIKDIRDSLPDSQTVRPWDDFSGYFQEIKAKHQRQYNETDAQCSAHIFSVQTTIKVIRKKMAEKEMTKEEREMYTASLEQINDFTSKMPMFRKQWDMPVVLMQYLVRVFADETRTRSHKVEGDSASQVCLGLS